MAHSVLSKLSTKAYVSFYVSAFFPYRWSYPAPWAWTATSLQCLTTCSSTTTRNTAAELAGWSQESLWRTQWNMVRHWQDNTAMSHHMSLVLFYYMLPLSYTLRHIVIQEDGHGLTGSRAANPVFFTMIHLLYSYFQKNQNLEISDFTVMEF